VKDFRADLASLRTKFETLKRKQSETLLSQNRNELFGRRGYNSATPENPYAVGSIKTNGGLTKEMMLQNEGSFIRRTEGQLDEFIGRGMAVLDNLVEQRGFLKVCFFRGISDLQDAQRKVLDAGNTLGLSRDTIRFIERRTTQDKYIFYGGAVFTLACFWFIYRWIRG
jgi:golgi SNAP receptor complex member 2